MKSLAIFVLALASVLPMSAQKTVIPTFTSIYPDHTYVNVPMTVTISGKNFRSGMVLLISGPYGSIPMQTMVINQGRATAIVDGTILQTPGIKRIYLLTKQGLIDSGDEYFQICSPFSIATTQIPVYPDSWNVGTTRTFQLQLAGGCQ